MVYLSTNIEGHPNLYLTIITSTDNNYSAHHDTQRFFQCKTCNRQFSSFQALGGHRASHKKPRTLMETDNAEELQSSPPKLPKIHKCSVCGLEFAIGQALGGHMRRHRDGGAATNENRPPPLDLSVPVVRKSNSRRVLCLDLNLTPLENDVELEFQLGHKVAPAFW